MNAIQNRKALNGEKPFPGCLGRMVNLFDLCTGVEIGCIPIDLVMMVNFRVDTCWDLFPWLLSRLFYILKVCVSISLRLLEADSWKISEVIAFMFGSFCSDIICGYHFGISLLNCSNTNRILEMPFCYQDAHPFIVLGWGSHISENMSSKQYLPDWWLF